MSDSDDIVLSEFQMEILRAVHRGDAMESPRTSEHRDLMALVELGLLTVVVPGREVVLTEKGRNKIAGR